MDGSENEYDGYDMEADDDEAQDEYDEIPDDEEDDDMDDDDDVDVPADLQDAMNGLVSHLRIINRGDMQALRTDGMGGEARVGLFSLDTGSAGGLATEEVFRSLMENMNASSMDFGLGRDVPVFGGRGAARRGFQLPSLSHMPNFVPIGRSRGGYFSGGEFPRDGDAAERVHPALHRPETPRASSSGRSDNLRNLEYILSSMGSPGTRHLISGITVNLDPFRPSAESTRIVQQNPAAVDDAITSIGRLSQLISAEGAEPVQHAPQTGNLVDPQPAGGATLAGTSSAGAQTASVRAEGEEDESNPADPNPTPAVSASRTSLPVGPMTTRFGSGPGPFSRMDPGPPPWMRPPGSWSRLAVGDDMDSAINYLGRRASTSRMSRERDRTSSARRWTYDPPGTGGDDLPALFGGDARAQRSRDGPTTERRGSNPLASVAALSFESVNKMEERVLDRLAVFAVEMRKIDHSVQKSITEAKKRVEKKKKKASKDEVKKTEDSGGNTDASPVVAPAPAPAAAGESLAEIAERALNEIAGDPAAAQSRLGDFMTALEFEVNEPPAAVNEGDDDGDGEDNVMEQDAEVEIPIIDVGGGSTASADVAVSAANPAPETDTMHVGTPPDEVVAAAADAPSGVDAGTATEGANGSFPTAAAARAAAIGISLDAPANSDPSVVQAALDSTGIDPTFLSALPDEMRADVLNEHFQRVRSNAPPAAEAGAALVSTLNQDFLIALPPELRAEVLEAEAEYEARNSGGNTAGGAGAGGANGGADDAANAAAAAAPDMDNASFLATLTPELREEILLTAPDALLSSFPPEVAAEARSLRERDAANRAQSHPFGSGETPIMFRRDTYGYDNGMAMMRRGAREIPREPIGMRWEKVEGEWTRVGPTEKDEPKSALDDDALSAVVQLLRLKSSTFGKSVVFHVLASACKNSRARGKVLTLLLNMVTCADEGKSTTSTDSAVYAAEGTIVRRALELLVQLCKNDQSVAEALIGLPTASTEKPAEDAEDDVVPQKKRCESSGVLKLSTLTSLMSAPLFTRSNAHLQQLLLAISYVCQAFPPSRAGKSKKHRLPSVSELDALLSQQRYEAIDVEDDDDDSTHRHVMVQMGGGMYGARDREMAIAETLEAQFGGPHARDFAEFRVRRLGGRVVDQESGDGEQGSSSSDEEEGDGDATRVVQEEGGNSVVEETAEAGEGVTEGDAPATAAGNADEDRPTPVVEGDKTKKTKTKKEKKQDVVIPVECRVPNLAKDDLNALVLVLKKKGFPVWTYDLVSIALGQLGELPSNRSVTVAALSQSAQDLGVQVKKAYAKFKTELEPASASVEKRKQYISQFAMGSYACELTLLRLIKTASTLLNQTSKKGKSAAAKRQGDSADAKAAKPSQSSEVMTELRESKELVFRGLQELWKSLDEILDLVNADLDRPEKGKKKGQIPGSEYRSAGRTEGIARMSRNRNSRKNLSPVLARLSPTIESFFIAHSALIDTEVDGKGKEAVSSPVPMSPRESVFSPGGSSDTIEGNESVAVMRKLGKFIERHRVPVNALLRSNPSLLETSFNMALKHAHAIDFDNKKAYFRSLIKKRGTHNHPGAKTVRLKVRRNRVYEDSFSQLRGRTKDEMKGRLHVQFTGEEGVDAGGVTREWYIILARQIFDANYALFCKSAAKAATYQPEKQSWANPEHLENFKFVGRVIAKAIYDGQLIDAYFTRSFYKHILGIKPTYHDIEAQDPDYYNSLKWILENDITGVLDHTMSAEYEEFGQHVVLDLLPNGRNIPVTEENKADYVRLVTEVRLTKAISKQIEAFKKGFHELIPLEDCKIFNELELELLMSGLPDIDMADLKANVEYTGYSSSSPQINWFWRCVEQMDQEDLARLVMFVTGTSKVPLEGFSALQGMNGAQKFQIHRVSGDTKRLPSAHTCFNQLDLPEYASAEVLKERILCAVRECNVGFGFA